MHYQCLCKSSIYFGNACCSVLPALIYPYLGNRATQPPALPEALLYRVQRGSSCCSLSHLLLLTSPNTTHVTTGRTIVCLAFTRFVMEKLSTADHPSSTRLRLAQIAAEVLVSHRCPGTIDRCFETIDHCFDTIDCCFETIDRCFETIDRCFETIPLP